MPTSDRVTVSRVQLMALSALLWQGQMNIHDFRPKPSDPVNGFAAFYTPERKSQMRQAISWLVSQMPSYGFDDRVVLSDWHRGSSWWRWRWNGLESISRAWRERKSPSVTFSVRQARFIATCLHDLLDVKIEANSDYPYSLRLMQDLVLCYDFTLTQAGPLQDLTLAQRIETMYQYKEDEHYTLTQIMEQASQ